MELDTLTHDDDEDDDDGDHSKENGLLHVRICNTNIEDNDDNYSDEKTLL